MTILSIRNLSFGFGAQPLLQNANLNINKGDKVCLLGRNGSGKSTLMKIIMGSCQADAGIIEKSPRVTLRMLNQTFPTNIEKSVYDVISETDEGDYNYDLEPYQIDSIISKFKLDGQMCFSRLSGGLKRRTLLAKAVVNQPDILLLDEPTNHLDIASIEWLDTFLKQYAGTIILITHDRQLMQTVGNHFVEIDRGKLISWRGDYQGFLAHKDFIAATEDKANALFDKKLAEEEVWIRQGIKARRTRNEGRVRTLKKMRDEFKERRQKIGNVKFGSQTNPLSGKEVFIVDNVSFKYHSDNTTKNVIKNFSAIVLRGEKIGILGPNGAGKSTLIKLLLKELEPTQGNVKHGTKLEVVYYDQHRQQLEEEKTIFDNVCEGSDYIVIGEKRIHIMSYLQDFLFSPQRIRTPVKALSGGEKNRVMLAKLFMKSANVMILDEPTNDLDIETLELLEEQLMHYQGTVLLVSHDRSFINNIVTSTWVFESNSENDGKIQEYAGGYDDWLIQRKASLSKPTTASLKKKDDFSHSTATKENQIQSNKLNYHEQRELAKLPKQIEDYENKIASLHHILADPNFYQKSSENIVKVNQELTMLNAALKNAYDRWEELEQRRNLK